MLPLFYTQCPSCLYFTFRVQAAFILHSVSKLPLFYIQCPSCLYFTLRVQAAFILHSVSMLPLFYTQCPCCLYFTLSVQAAFILHSVSRLPLFYTQCPGLVFSVPFGGTCCTHQWQVSHFTRVARTASVYHFCAVRATAAFARACVSACVRARACVCVCVCVHTLLTLEHRLWFVKQVVDALPRYIVWIHCLLRDWFCLSFHPPPLRYPRTACDWVLHLGLQVL